MKVKVTRMYFDGEKRVRPGEILDIEEKDLNETVHEVLSGAKASVKSKAKSKPVSLEEQTKESADDESPL